MILRSSFFYFGLMKQIKLDQEKPSGKEDNGKALRQKCYEAALQLLSLRPRSRHELEEKLARRGFQASIIADVLGELAEVGQVDDTSFARYWKENRTDFRPRSRRLMAMELRRKGVGNNAITEALADADDAESALRATREKVRKTVFSGKEDFQRRLGGYLRRRGFDYEVIRRALDSVWQENNTVLNLCWHSRRRVQGGNNCQSVSV